MNEYDHLRVKFADSFGYYYRGHPSRIPANGLGHPLGGRLRVPRHHRAGTGGQTKIPRIRTASATPCVCTFADPDNDRPGQRLFDVTIQGQTVLTGFDIVREAGGRHHALVKEFKGVRVKERLVLGFTVARPGRGDRGVGAVAVRSGNGARGRLSNLPLAACATFAKPQAATTAYCFGGATNPQRSPKNPANTTPPGTREVRRRRGRMAPAGAFLGCPW